MRHRPILRAQTISSTVLVNLALLGTWALRIAVRQHLEVKPTVWRLAWCLVRLPRS
jgi:hypothetical protein